MEWFTAVCEMIQVPIDEEDVEYRWEPSLRQAYKIPQHHQATQADERTGNPDPAYCLFHGLAEEAVIEQIRKDLDGGLIGTAAVREPLTKIQAVLQRWGIPHSSLNEASTVTDVAREVLKSIYPQT